MLYTGRLVVRLDAIIAIDVFLAPCCRARIQFIGHLKFNISLIFKYQFIRVAERVSNEFVCALLWHEYATMVIIQVISRIKLNKEFLHISHSGNSLIGNSVKPHNTNTMTSKNINILSV